MKVSRRLFAGRALGVIGGVAALATTGLPAAQEAVTEIEAEAPAAESIGVRVLGTTHIIPLDNFPGLKDAGDFYKVLSDLIREGRDVTVQFEGSKPIFQSL